MFNGFYYLFHLQFSIELAALQHSLIGVEKSEQGGMSAAGKRHLEHCKDSVKTIEDVTAFMLSTINRCLDYTKASTGLALTASNSSLDVRAALQWAIDCIRRSKENNNITLQSLSDDISDYIVSDQQVNLVTPIYIPTI
jgi:hypothetical protein